MSFVATAIIGSAVLGGITSKQASDAQSRSASNSIAEQRRQFDLNYSDQAPYREAGVNALERINALRDGDMSGFTESPGYQFNLEQGQKAIDRMGRGLGGRQQQELLKFSQGLAGQEYGNYYNRLAGQAGVGQTSVNQTGAAGMGMASNIGNAMQNQGNAKANAWQGFNQAGQQGISNFMLADYLKPAGGGATPWDSSGRYGSSGLNDAIRVTR